MMNQKIETRLIDEKFASVMDFHKTPKNLSAHESEERVAWNWSWLVYLQLNKKKAKAEGKTCHAKTMLSLEKPIKLI